MISDDGYFTLRLARDARDLAAAQRLRYRVFVQEMGGDGPLVDHAQALECDAFDARADHLLLIDTRRDARALEDVVGVYRLLRADQLERGARFYTEDEFDVSPLRATGRRLLELGRSCLHPDYRGGTAMHHLWGGLAAYIMQHRIEILFGTASFAGTDAAALAQPLAYLVQHHLAPLELRCAGHTPWPPSAAPLDRRAALLALPPLIKAYLRLGGFVGDGIWIDHAFRTIDVCLILDTARMSAPRRAAYLPKGAL